MELSPVHQKVLDIYHNDGHDKAWTYWKLMGLNYGIFLGEVPSSEFITGDDLASSIGLTSGVSQYSETSWLKFILDGEIVHFPKRPIRNSISWKHIYKVGAVYGTDDFGLFPRGVERLQDVRVIIDSNEYRVTLMKGANSDPALSDSTGYDVDWTHGSEWNRLMYPVHSCIHIHRSNPSDPSGQYNQWASYYDDDLIADYRAGYGSYCWTQEQHPSAFTHRVNRGGGGVTNATRCEITSTDIYDGWRPILRLVEYDTNYI